jgi:hypothetical protein
LSAIPHQYNFSSLCLSASLKPSFFLFLFLFLFLTFSREDRVYQLSLSCAVFYSSMAPHLIKTSKIQILGETSNSVVYAVDTDSATDLADDSPTVLKGGTVWYKGEKPFGDKIDDKETDRNLRKEADLYKAIGSHARIVRCHGLEAAAAGRGVRGERSDWLTRFLRLPRIRTCRVPRVGRA